MIKRYIITFAILLFLCTTVLAAQGEDMAAEEECNPRAFVIPLPYKKGNAAPEEVLEGRTFTNKDTVNAPGTMPDRGAVTITPTTVDQNIPEGYHNGSGAVVGDPNLISGNIRAGATIFGVSGMSLQATGNATPEQVLEGMIFSNANGEATGRMQEIAASTITPGTNEQTIPMGFHSGNGKVMGEPALVKDNIRINKMIYGVRGEFICSIDEIESALLSKCDDECAMYGNCTQSGITQCDAEYQHCLSVCTDNCSGRGGCGDRLATCKQGVSRACSEYRDICTNCENTQADSVNQIKIMLTDICSP